MSDTDMTWNYSSGPVVFIILHDPDNRKEHMLNVAEISSVIGDRNDGKHNGGAQVAMRNGHRFDCYEGTERVAQLMRSASRQ